MNSATQQKNHTLPIAMMFLLFFIISFVTNLQAPMGGILKAQLNLDTFMSLLGNMAVFLAYLFMGVPSGVLIEKKGYKATALIALITGFIGVGIMYISGNFISSKGVIYPVYLLGAFISGFSMCMLNAVVNPMLSVLGDSKGANQRLNLGGAINSVGATLSVMLGGAFVSDPLKAAISDVNPLLFLAMGIFALVFVVLYMTAIPEPQTAKKESSSIKSKYSALSFRHFKIGMFTIFCYTGVEVALSVVTIQWMEALEYPKSVAGSIVGVYWLLMLVGRLTGGALGKIFTSKQMLLTSSSLGIIFVLVAIFSGNTYMINFPTVDFGSLSFGMKEVPLGIVFLVLCGLCTSVMWAGIFNLATNGLGKYTAQGSGLFMTMVFGGGVIPLLQGKLVDVVGFEFSYFVAVFCFAAVLFFALVGSKNVNKDILIE